MSDNSSDVIFRDRQRELLRTQFSDDAKAKMATLSVKRQNKIIDNTLYRLRIVEAALQGCEDVPDERTIYTVGSSVEDMDANIRKCIKQLSRVAVEADLRRYEYIANLFDNDNFDRECEELPSRVAARCTNALGDCGNVAVFMAVVGSVISACCFLVHYLHKTFF